MTDNWSWDMVPGLDPEVRAHVDPPRWRIWSATREEWLRQDAMGWTAWPTSAGTWTEAGARERADDLPVEDKAVAVEGEG